MNLPQCSLWGFWLVWSNHPDQLDLDLPLFHWCQNCCHWRRRDSWQSSPSVRRHEQSDNWAIVNILFYSHPELLNGERMTSDPNRSKLTKSLHPDLNKTLPYLQGGSINLESDFHSECVQQSLLFPYSVTPFWQNRKRCNEKKCLQGF